MDESVICTKDNSKMSGGHSRTKLWFDPTTGFALRLTEDELQSDGVFRRGSEWEEILVNVPLADELFELAVPAGYQRRVPAGQEPDPLPVLGATPRERRGRRTKARNVGGAADCRRRGAGGLAAFGSRTRGRRDPRLAVECRLEVGSGSKRPDRAAYLALQLRIARHLELVADRCNRRALA